MAWCAVSDAVHDFFPLSMKGKVPAAPLLASLVRLWPASLWKAGKAKSLVSPPCYLEWGLMWGLMKCTLLVAKGKPSANTSYITFPELIVFCFAKSVGFSGTHHFQVHSCHRQGHLFNFQSAFYWLTYSYARIHCGSSILSLSLIFGPSSSSLVQNTWTSVRSPFKTSHWTR